MLEPFPERESLERNWVTLNLDPKVKHLSTRGAEMAMDYPLLL